MLMFAFLSEGDEAATISLGHACLFGQGGVVVPSGMSVEDGRAGAGAVGDDAVCAPVCGGKGFSLVPVKCYALTEESSGLGAYRPISGQFSEGVIRLEGRVQLQHRFRPELSSG